MATVKITNDLLERTSRKVDHMRDVEIKSLAPSFGMRTYMDVSHIYHLCTWGEDYIPLINQIPESWLVKTEEASFRIKCEGYTDDIRVAAKGLSRAFNPPTTERWGHSGVAGCTEEFLLGLPSHMTGLTELRAELQVAKTAEDLRLKWKKIGADVSEFLKKCTTLNEAIKLFPNIRMYINLDDLERHDRKIEKSANRKSIVENLDMDSLTAAAIASKLSF